VAIVAPESADQVAQVFASPAKYLAGQSKARGRERKELALLALIRMAASDPDAAATQIEGGWGAQLNGEERNWAWAVAGKQAAFKLSPDANSYFGKVRRNEDLSDDLLGWKARAALRAGDWKAVRRAIDAMGPERTDPTWAYWKAKAMLAGRPNAEERPKPASCWRTRPAASFYEQLALEEIGQRITVPPAPAPLTAQEKAARSNPGLSAPVCHRHGPAQRRRARVELLHQSAPARRHGRPRAVWPPIWPASARSGIAASTPASAPRPLPTGSSAFPCPITTRCWPSRAISGWTRPMSMA
jgi:hypothetical protein